MSQSGLVQRQKKREKKFKGTCNFDCLPHDHRKPQSRLRCAGELSVLSKMGTSNFSFARTLEAVDKSIIDPDARFTKFNSLPPEIRLAIWESLLPTAEDETPVIFAQNREDGILDMSEDLVPIRMTTTCAALLHVNQESRRATLSWAASLGYKLCHRARCFDSDFWAECDACYEDDDFAVVRHDRQVRETLPVQGPIFVRPWSAEKDIFSVTYTTGYGGFPDSWDDEYRSGEQLPNIQHLAFNMKENTTVAGSRWFYQVIGAMPNLKSISFDYDLLEDPRSGQYFAERYIETRDVFGDSVVGAGEQYGSSTRDGRRRRRVRARWEPIDFEYREKAQTQYIEMFEWYFMQGYFVDKMWPPDAPPGADLTWDAIEEWDKYVADEAIYDSQPRPWTLPRNRERLLRVPPWIWDHDKGEFAFISRGFRMLERRGYDDVGGGHVVPCADLYGDTWVRDHQYTGK